MPRKKVTKQLEKSILCVDMDAFFASVEQQSKPQLRGKPVAITNGNQGSCIITCSYEARQFGIKTGMPLWQAKRLCPGLIQQGSRPEVYAGISRRLMTWLYQSVTPDIQVFSVDEAFLDITKVLGMSKCPYTVAKWIQTSIKKKFGLPCSVGVAEDKTMSKLAAKLKKPLGITVIPRTEYQQVLTGLPLGELCGLGPKIVRYLASRGVHTCDQAAQLPVSVLSKRWGCSGQRLWLMCRGMDPEPVLTQTKDAQSMGHGKVLPPTCVSPDKILYFCQQMAFKLCKRLQVNGFYAKRIWIGLYRQNQGWHEESVVFDTPSRDHQRLAQAIKDCVSRWPINVVCRKVQITATGLTKTKQLGFDFNQTEQTKGEKQDELQTMIQAIHNKFGQAAIKPARLQKELSMPDVISPAWKPEGARQSLSLKRLPLGLGR